MKKGQQIYKNLLNGKIFAFLLCVALVLLFVSFRGFGNSSEKHRKYKPINWNPGMNEPRPPKGIGDTLAALSSGGNLSEVGTWGYGPSETSFVLNNHLYMGSGRMMVIWDVTDPSSPVKLGKIAFPGYIVSLYVNGDYAYVGLLSGGLRVADVSDPSSPMEVGVFDTGPGRVSDIYVDGIYAYVVHSGLRILDISNPALPTEVGRLRNIGSASGVHVNGNYAYVAVFDYGLRVVDVSNPALPVEVGSISTYYPNKVYVSGSYAYVAALYSGFKIISVLNPQAPVLKSAYSFSTFLPNDVYVSDSYAYVSCSREGLFVFNVSDPKFPYVEDKWETWGTPRGVYVSGDYAYVADDSAGVCVVNVSDPTRIFRTAQIEGFEETRGLYASDSYVYITNLFQGLRVIDVTNPSTPTEVGKLGNIGAAVEIFVSGSYAYIAAANQDLRIVDISNPFSPVEVSYYDYPGAVRGVSVSGNYAYVVTSGEGFRVIDIKDPHDPAEVGFCNWPTASLTGEIQLVGNYAYVGDYNEFIIIDISTPAAPVLVGQLGIPSGVYGLYILGSYAYVTDSSYLRIIDIGNVENPVEVVSYLLSNSLDVYVNEPYAFVGTHDALHVINVNNPASPFEVDSLTIPGNHWDLKVSEGYAYTVNEDCGVSIIDVSFYAPSIKVNSPNGGEKWLVDSVQNITWTTRGIVGNLKIESSTNNGENWAEITASTENDGSHPWTVPADVSDQCLIRVSETGGSLSDVSDNVFSIIIPAITVTAPNGGETWEVGTLRNITWTSEGIEGNVTIEYSINNGTSWRSIKQAAENDGAFKWKVRNFPSDNCLIRVCGGDADGNPADISDEVFSIALPVSASITVTSPNGGEQLTTDSSHEIKWTAEGTDQVKDVIIEYSTNRGETWTTIVPAMPNASNGSYQWTVPDTPSEHCIVRVTGIDVDAPPSDTSDDVFSIAPTSPPTITITFPNGGETLVIGTKYEMTWESNGEVGDVKIEYSFNNGNSWAVITESTANSGNFEWTFQDDPSDNCLVRISDTGGNASDVSDSVFSLVPPPSITVTSPNGGEQWEPGTTQPITWETTGLVGSVKIDYSTNSGETWTEIISTTANSGRYDWLVPDTPSDNCLIRVSGGDSDKGTTDASDEIFSILAPASPSITVLLPNGGEHLLVDSLYEIKWTSAGDVGDVKIDYSTDNAETWTEIIPAAENDGIYEWTVPDTPSGNCLVRVSDVNGDPWDESDCVFSIVSSTLGNITVTAPNGGEQWAMGSPYEITWTSTGVINNVFIKYSTNNGASWATIAESTDNNGSYQWAVPGTPSDNCLVHIGNADADTDGEPSDTSDQVFSIVSSSPAAVRVVTPNGGETWELGMTCEIIWASNGTNGVVKIECSTDNAASWDTIVTSTDDTGNYFWTIPDNPASISDSCRVRISSNAAGSDEDLSDVSDEVFSIVSPAAPTLFITSPNGGEKLLVDYNYEITWTSTGMEGNDNVMLEYSTDNGDTWADIIASTENDGSHGWTIPDNPSEACLIRVSDTANQGIYDVSNNVFSIIYPSSAFVTVTTPNGGENLTVGSEYEITWTSSELNNVVIEYSPNNGAGWVKIDSVPAGDGSYLWVVPDTPSQNCLVRISGSDSDEDPSDVSDAVFSII